MVLEWGYSPYQCHKSSEDDQNNSVQTWNGSYIHVELAEARSVAQTLRPVSIHSNHVSNVPNCTCSTARRAFNYNMFMESHVEECVCSDELPGTHRQARIEHP